MNVLESLVDVFSKLVDMLYSSLGRSKASSSSVSSSTMPDFPEMKPERTQIWPEQPEDAGGEELGETPSNGSVGGFTITLSVDIRP